MRITTSTALSALVVLLVAACSSPGGDAVGEASTLALSTTGVFKGLAGKCLDGAASAVNGTQARLWDCNGTAAQQWTVTDGGQIVGSGGKCLDVSGASSANGTAVILWDCHGGTNQTWSVQSNRVVGLGGKCLDVAKGDTSNGAPIIIWTCNGRSNQAWTFQPTSTTSGGTTGTTTDAGTTTTTTDAGTATAATRDVLKWPFASNSIWNMPIGSGAVFAAANLTDDPGGDIWAPMPQIDPEHIVLRPTAPLTDIYYSDAGWSDKDRCTPTGSLLMQVPIPTDYLVPSSNTNAGAAFLLADGRTILQSQPLARCTAGGVGTSLVKFSPVDIYGDGRLGAHGGSELSSIGGSLRVGELRPGGQPPRHAIKVNVDPQRELAKCATFSECYRWPASTADSAWTLYGAYGTASPYMKMGALLAIPGSVSLANLGFETEPGKMLAWTLQNYGAYIVDSTGGPAFAISAENGPDGSFVAQFQQDWGFPVEQRVRDATPWVRDIQRIRRALMVVNNNSTTSIGGGGTPRQPLAPAL